MYSVQHVLWRGAMALSLLVVGGVGAGVSEQSREPEAANECGEEIDAQVALRIAPLPHTNFDVVVIRAIQRSMKREPLNARVIEIAAR